MKISRLPLPPPALPAPIPGSIAQRYAAIAQSLAIGVPPDYGRLRRLRKIAEPARLAFVGFDMNARPQWLTPRAAKAWLRMRHHAASDMIELQLVSAYRSTEYQLGLIERKLQHGQSIEQILKVSAAPGYSEHHSGRALDVSTPGSQPLEEAFEQTSAFAWLTRHAAGFGFRLSYPRGNPHGIAYEPWHWCWHRT